MRGRAATPTPVNPDIAAVLSLVLGGRTNRLVVDDDVGCDGAERRYEGPKGTRESGADGWPGQRLTLPVDRDPVGPVDGVELRAGAARVHDPYQSPPGEQLPRYPVEERARKQPCLSQSIRQPGEGDRMSKTPLPDEHRATSLGEKADFRGGLMLSTFRSG